MSIPNEADFMNHYILMGIQRDATPAQVKKAYWRKALLFHPDKNLLDEKEAEKKFKELGAAYATLSNPRERKRYDYTLPMPLDELIRQISSGERTSCIGNTHRNLPCERAISKSTRDEILVKSKALLSLTKPASAARRDIVALASLLFCKGFHHDQAMGPLVAAWELELHQKDAKFRKDTKPSEVSAVDTFRKSDGKPNIRKLFGLSAAAVTAHCISKQSCMKVIPKKDLDRASVVITTIETFSSVNDTEPLLKMLAGLVLCDEHWDQVDTKASVWHLKLAAALKQTEPAKPTTDTPCTPKQEVASSPGLDVARERSSVPLPRREHPVRQPEQPTRRPEPAPIERSAPRPRQIHVLKVLNLEENIYNCTGTTLKGERCRNPRWEPKNTQWELDSILRTLSTKGTFDSEAKSLLSELTHLLLCKRYHQGQAEGKMRAWSARLERAINEESR
ncbi:MAG: hypothetical protein M1837_002695 [Sclerophora amabilis]|nr:MAG: hypothetical protein M1837_002695 [Sclerophora amabilis]